MFRLLGHELTEDNLHAIFGELVSLFMRLKRNVPNAFNSVLTRDDLEKAHWEAEIDWESEIQLHPEANGTFFAVRIFKHGKLDGKLAIPSSDPRLVENLLTTINKLTDKSEQCQLQLSRILVQRPANAAKAGVAA
jgi:hypothetical protein